MQDDKKTNDERMADNDFAERFWKIIFNGVVMFILLLILAITLFKGSPDLVDNIGSAIANHGATECQSP